MKHTKRAVALLLSAALMAGMLAGCAGDPNAQYKTEDIISQLTDGATARDTVLVNVDGDPITAEALLYWAIYDCDYLAAYYYGGAENMSWSDTFTEDQTLSEYILSDALNTAKLYRILESHAKADGITLTDEDLATLQADVVDKAVEQQGGTEKFTQWLSQIGLSFDAYYQLNSIQYLYQHYLKNISDEDMDQYLTDQQLYRVKHILISTTGTDGSAMSDADKTAAKEKAEGLLQQLRDAEDPITLFDELMTANSEDPGLSQYPDGYTAVPGDMMEPFEKASLALAENQISDLVETDAGYHIILRLDADTEDTRGQYFDATLDGWMTSAVVEETEAYQNFNLEGFYNALTEYRLSLQEAQEPTDTTSPSPTETTPAGTTQPTGSPEPTN